MKKRIAVLCCVCILLLTACTKPNNTQVSDLQEQIPDEIWIENCEEPIATPTCAEEFIEKAPPEDLPDENCPLEHVIEESDVLPEPEATPIPDQPPSVSVVGEKGTVYETLLGTYCWSNGSFTTEACALHPLDAIDLLPVVETAAAGHSVCLEFDGLHMENYTVKYWEVGADYDESNIATVDRNCGRIEFDLSTAGKQCVYSVWVTYPEGEAEYCFLVDYNCR